MSTEVTKKPKVLRKATFTVEKVKGQRIFRPVNKRAHKLALTVGKRTRITPEDIKAFKEAGIFKIAVYDKEGNLRTARV